MEKMLRIAATGGLVVLVAAAMSGLLTVKEASALMSSKSDLMTRLQDNTASDHTITFTTSVGVPTTQTITATFPGAFETGTIVLADVDVRNVTDAHDLTTAADCNGSEEAGVVMAADVLTVTICSEYTGGIGAGEVVEIQIGTNAGGTHQITNPDIASDTSYDIAIGGTMADSGNIRIQILMDDSVNVTATVDETISFAISDTTIGFGDLVSANARFATGDAVGADADSAAAHTMTIGTNATGGYIITYNGPTLTSGSNTINVASITDDADGTQGSEQFGMGFSTGGNATIAAAYDHNATPANRDWAFVASTATTVVSETVPTATETISAFYLGNIASNTEAGSYSTDVTYIATATFQIREFGNLN